MAQRTFCCNLVYTAALNETLNVIWYDVIAAGLPCPTRSALTPSGGLWIETGTTSGPGLTAAVVELPVILTGIVQFILTQRSNIQAHTRWECLVFFLSRLFLANRKTSGFKRSVYIDERTRDRGGCHYTTGCFSVNILLTSRVRVVDFRNYRVTLCDCHVWLMGKFVCVWTSGDSFPVMVSYVVLHVLGSMLFSSKYEN